MTFAIDPGTPTVLDAVGVGAANNPPTAMTAPALKQAGTSRVLYIGVESCRYCASQRWAVAQALSRFGAWAGLGQTTSSATDVESNTAS